MKFARFNGGRTGLVVGHKRLEIIDVHASLGPLGKIAPAAAETIRSVLPEAAGASWVEMIGRWEDVRGAFEQFLQLANADFERIAFEKARLEPPLASPLVHIYALGSNTVVHIQRAFQQMKGVELSEADILKPRNEGLPPGGFTVWPATVVGPDATVTPPRGTRKLDYEGECAVYVRSPGRNQEHVAVWGYAGWNDLGVRDSHLGLAKESPWIPYSFNLPKNFDSGNACGPWVVVDEVESLEALRCVVKVNGDIRQDWALSEMIYSFDETLRYLSNHTSLRPGDMLTSGTGAGLAIEGGIDSPFWLKPGDVVEVELEGAGTLRNVIGDW